MNEECPPDPLRKPLMINRPTTTILLLLFFSPAAPVPTRPLESHLPQKTLQVLLEGEDPVMAELFGRELQDMAAKTGASISLIGKDATPYDLRILLTSGVGSKTASCTGSCSNTGTCTDSTSSVSCSATSCSVTITIYFASAAVLKPDGSLQSADAGVGITRVEARKLLARKLVSRL
jgi:hypothetical protein